MEPSLPAVAAALVTPFTQDGEAVDEAALRALVDRLLDGGVDGLVPCGSTGEVAALSDDERRLVVEVVVDQAAGRVPVIAHTGGCSTRQAVALSRHAAAHGAAAVLVITPYYLPFDLDELFAYHAEVAAAVDLPVLAYNIPAATGVSLPPPFVARLGREIENLVGVKDSSGDLLQVTRLLSEAGDGLAVANGWDTLTLPALLLGARLILGSVNVLPRETVELCAAVREGDHARAIERWRALHAVAEVLTSGGYVTALKAALEMTGHPAGPARAPSAPVGAERREQLRRALADVGARPAGAAG